MKASSNSHNQHRTGLSGRFLFGRRFMQFDGKMKSVEQAWRAGLIPDLPLAFDTALIVPKSK
jgi:hypothetical protein